MASKKVFHRKCDTEIFSSTLFVFQGYIREWWKFRNHSNTKMGSLSCHSEETEEGVLLVYSGEINPIRGVTDDSRMETITVNQDPSNTCCRSDIRSCWPNKVCYLGKRYLLNFKE